MPQARRIDTGSSRNPVRSGAGVNRDVVENACSETCCNDGGKPSTFQQQAHRPDAPPSRALKRRRRRLDDATAASFYSFTPGTTSWKTYPMIAGQANCRANMVFLGWSTLTGYSERPVVGGRGSCRACIFRRLRLGGSLALPSRIASHSSVCPEGTCRSPQCRKSAEHSRLRCPSRLSQASRIWLLLGEVAPLHAEVVAVRFGWFRVRFRKHNRVTTLSRVTQIMSSQ
jgi:hypothetical protein